MDGYTTNNDTTTRLNAASSGQQYINYFFKRAKGFFDVVAYEGDGIAGRTVDHNLGVVPEMMWVKTRAGGLTPFTVYTSFGGPTKYNYPNSTQAIVTDADMWTAGGTPTADNFTVGSYTNVNASAYTYIAYLFATLAGISKVGSYTGNGGNQMINCDFSSGARFVMIKRTDSTGDWYMWDTARGIVTGNDPHLSLNTTAAEVTTNDSIDPAPMGFIVNQDVATNINVNAGEYIFYAIA